jgi:apolipoprotein N-acyltransferase
VHNWYPNIFPPVLGYFLIVAVGTFYARMIQLGTWLQSRLPGALKLLALPVVWAAVEFVNFIAPVVEDWWFVLLTKSAWRFPPALQILSLTGFPGLSFLVMLANVAIAGLVIRQSGIRKQGIPKRASIAALVVVAGVLLWGALTIPSAPADTFTIAALTDMVNQDSDILSTSEFALEDFGTSANSPETSQAIFNVDAALSRQVAAQEPDFIIWPENEFRRRCGLARPHRDARYRPDGVSRGRRSRPPGKDQHHRWGGKCRLRSWSARVSCLRYSLWESRSRGLL